MFLLSVSFVVPLCSVTSLLTNYFNHRIAYDDVAQTNHTIASICNRLRCEKECPLPQVLIR